MVTREVAGPEVTEVWEVTLDSTVPPEPGVMGELVGIVEIPVQDVLEGMAVPAAEEMAARGLITHLLPEAEAEAEAEVVRVHPDIVAAPGAQLVPIRLTVWP